MEEAAPDGKPGRILALYVPLVLGVLTSASVSTNCDCEVTFLRALMQVTMGAVVCFVSWWFAVMVCFHGYHFVRALFDHPN
jgi:hypothetical protein